MTTNSEALAGALGWSWEPAPGVPSVSTVTVGILDELAEAGWSLVPTTAVADAWDVGYSAGATPLPRTVPRPTNPHRAGVA